MSRITRYRRGRFALLLGCLLTALTVPFSAPAHLQSRRPGKVTLKVILKADDQAAAPVQNFGLVVKKLNDGSAETVISPTALKTGAPESMLAILKSGLRPFPVFISVALVRVLS